jgi:hypothetical protein
MKSSTVRTSPATVRHGEQMSGGGLRPGAWVGVDEAAGFLSVSAVTPRRSLERNARRHGDGSVSVHVDGITARKLGRLWRVWLDAAWLDPRTSKM